MKDFKDGYTYVPAEVIEKIYTLLSEEEKIGLLKWNELDEDYIIKSKLDDSWKVRNHMETFECPHCGSKSFKVGTEKYFTAVKCENCKTEICVHEG